MNKKICIINCFWGKWPNWFNFFQKSCEYNSQIDWLFFSDNKINFLNINNIRFIPLTREKFNSLATHKLSFKVETKNPYKVCDFKPAYGKIFEDYLSDYNFWGYCDIDLIFGKIDHFIDNEVLNKYDIISFYRRFLSGPLCLFRNIDKINLLYKKIPDYISILKTPSCLSFDENLVNGSEKDNSAIRFLHFLKFLFLSLINQDLETFNFREIRYQYQWYLKKKKLREDNISDMTDMVNFAARNKEIKPYFKGLLISDVLYERMNKTNWEIKWEQGVLKDIKNGREIIAFHFRKLKNEESFKVYYTENQINKIIINKMGIKNE